MALPIDGSIGLFALCGSGFRLVGTFVVLGLRARVGLFRVVGFVAAAQQQCHLLASLDTGAAQVLACGVQRQRLQRMGVGTGQWVG